MDSLRINFRDLVILVSDANPYMSMLVHSMLRGFGANKVLEVRSTVDVIQTLDNRKIDLMLCDARLPPDGGLKLVKNIRSRADNENRTIPILLMAADTDEPNIKRARDAGVNMVIAKPMSPKNLYERLAWIAFNPRPFVDTENYFGPDRRFKIEGYPNGVGRRKGDMQVDVADDAGPALAQNDIDSLFQASRLGAE
jgi:two-component system, chemotaxis family, chemotaxis protein CheY